MRCEAAQMALSQWMDDPSASPSSDVQAHVHGCPVCSAYQSGAWRVRELARFEVAPQVPDLVASVMARVEEESRAGELARRLRPRRRLAGRPLWQTAFAAAVVGFLVGAAITVGGIIPKSAKDTSALAAEIPRDLVAAARTIDGYRATFAVTEENWARRVHRRSFLATVWFRAPESFRVSVRDTTPYPTAAWPRNDLTLVTDGRSLRVTGPNPCPRQALPACPTIGRVDQTTVGLPPFDPSTTRPTDIVVPMTVLAAQDRVGVVGEGSVAGRAAVAVELSYQDASPLFQYLRFLGSWRPFFPQDRVVVWIDRDTWFPLSYQVLPAPGPERALWASQSGFPKEPPERPVFTATVRSIDTERIPPATTFVVPRPPDAIDRAFRDGPPDAPQPTWTAGLPLLRSGRFRRGPDRAFDQTLAAYARGLAWITVTRVSPWTPKRPFGLGPFAEPVRLASGTGYYEPATSTDPRRVGVHSSEGEFVIASDLPRDVLLRVAGSLPVSALAQPESWRFRRWDGRSTEDALAPDQAVARAPFPVFLPAVLPQGYRASAAQLARTRTTTTLTIVFRRSAAELDGVGLMFTQAPGEALSPPQEASVEAVELRPNVVARWSPQRHLLEWVDGGAYRSLQSPAFVLSTLVDVARSLREVKP